MPPDFSVQNNFPISAVIDAAQRNNALQLQARTQGQQSLIDGFKAIGQLGESLYAQKQRVAQALAGAKQYAQTPEGQQMLGTNQVTTNPMGQPVSHNQTASFDPSTGTLTPNQSPVGIQDIAKSMEGMAPKDLFATLAQNKANDLAGREVTLKEKIEPKKLEIESELNKLLAGLKGAESKANIEHAESEDIASLLQRKGELTKNLPGLFGMYAGNDKAQSARDEIAIIDNLLNKKLNKSSGSGSGKFKTPSGASYTVG